MRADLKTKKTAKGDEHAKLARLTSSKLKVGQFLYFFVLFVRTSVWLSPAMQAMVEAITQAQARRREEDQRVVKAFSQWSADALDDVQAEQVRTWCRQAQSHLLLTITIA